MHRVKSEDNSVNRPSSFERFRILGAGRFGRLAAKRIVSRYPGARLLVVDADEERLRQVKNAFGVEVRLGDAVASLDDDPVSEETWIVPAVPVHVAFLRLLSALNAANRAGATESGGRFTPVPVPEAVDAQAPNPWRGSTDTLYASFASFRCPDSCNEPDEICTHTRQPRPGNLYEALSGISVPGHRVVVIRSLQLVPGVGGYTGGHLESALKEIQNAPDARYLIATSCRCHGVISAMSRAESQGA